MAFIAAIWTKDGKEEEEEEEEAEEGDLFVFVELGAHVADHGLHFGLAEAQFRLKIFYLRNLLV